MTEALIRFELGRAGRRGSLPAACVLFGLLAAGATALGLGSFRQLGLGTVSPAAVVLLNLGILFPSAYALMTGALALQADRDGGLLAMLRAAGLSGAGVTVAKLVATIVPSWVVVLSGFGASALVLGGSVGLADLAPFGEVLITALLVSAAAGAIGVLIAAAVRGRQQASTAGLAVWFTLAIGLDLLAIAITPALRIGPTGLLLIVLADPLEGGRVLGLLALGADVQVLGPFGAYLLATFGRTGATMVLILAQLAWIVVPAAIAARTLGRVPRGSREPGGDRAATAIAL